VLFLKPTGGGDKLCDNSKAKNSCELSFHGACYEHWGEAIIVNSTRNASAGIVLSVVMP
jgi:hypothetical protein